MKNDNKIDILIKIIQCWGQKKTGWSSLGKIIAVKLNAAAAQEEEEESEIWEIMRLLQWSGRQQRTEKVYNEAGARGAGGHTINLIWPDAADQKGQIKKEGWSKRWGSI